MVKWFGLKDILKTISFQPPCHVQGCSRSHPWSWTLLGMGHPQFCCATCSVTCRCNPQAMRKVVSFSTSKSGESKTVHSHLPISAKRRKWPRKLLEVALQVKISPLECHWKSILTLLDCWTVLQVLLAVQGKGTKIFLWYLLLVTNLTYVSQLGRWSILRQVIGLSAAVELGSVNILWAAAWKSLKTINTSVAYSKKQITLWE